MYSYRYKQKKRVYIFFAICCIILDLKCIYALSNYTDKNNWIIKIIFLLSIIFTIVSIIKIKTMKPENYPDPPGSLIGPRGELYVPTTPIDNSLTTVEQLEKLVKLYDKGIINDAEFEKQKRKIIK